MWEIHFGARKGNLEELLTIIQSNISEIDLSECCFVEPPFLLWLLSLYARKKISFINLEKPLLPAVGNYLERCGFFAFIGHKIAIRKFDRDTLVEITDINGDTTKNVNEMDIVTTKFLQHAQLTKEHFDDLYKTFYRIIWELIDNVLTHSQAQFWNKWCLYMMQFYPSKDYIHFSIVDNGIGIRESFKASYYRDPRLWYEYYIDLAFQKWVTRDKNIGAWNGLYGTMEIIKATWSDLLFYSGDTYCFQKWLDTTYTSWLPFWQGNLLDIKFNIRNLNKDVIDNLISKWALVKGLDIEELKHLDDLF